jgi:hypothetical protein
VTSSPLTPSSSPSIGLAWGVKGSFLTYLKHLPDREIYVGEGASVSGDRFHFPAGSEGGEYDVGQDKGLLKFAGDVRFSGHFGMLYVVFHDPWLEIKGRQGTLTVTDPAALHDHSRRIPLFNLSLPAPVVSPGEARWSQISTALRPEGVAMFGDTYAPGESFAPMDVVVSL